MRICASVIISVAAGTMLKRGRKKPLKQSRMETKSVSNKCANLLYMCGLGLVTWAGGGCVRHRPMSQYSSIVHTAGTPVAAIR